MTTKTTRKTLLPPSPLTLPASVPSVLLEERSPSLEGPTDSQSYFMAQETPTQPPLPKSIPIPATRRRSKSYIYTSSPHSPNSVLPLNPGSTSYRLSASSRLSDSTATKMSQLTLETSPVKRHKLGVNCDGSQQWGHKTCESNMKQNDGGLGLSTGCSSSHASAENSDITVQKNTPIPNRSVSNEQPSSQKRLNEQGQGHTVCPLEDCQRTTGATRV
ncbi:hypothetical protein CND01410 [Cryptococcus gattii WM276]|uniref:Uncharacterized protein n=2 Tax=Cryptococcus gattii TaxID=37769 RepID=E6R3R3_CRYGW|nr:uncharacterized protein CGB_D3620C [Cryptococcus gattii WM276]ADV21721.1 hypothetical protein CND01410 [Cryptococcus gattii WM276]KIR80634.1 hypothetical protein I306_02088 [Cryptococcus gattii EJB2]KJE04340.1 hypothetical protein I311_01821 [Cryptococcus gattii NT-10]